MCDSGNSPELAPELVSRIAPHAHTRTPTSLLPNLKGASFKEELERIRVARDAMARVHPPMRYRGYQDDLTQSRAANKAVFDKGHFPGPIGIKGSFPAFKDEGAIDLECGSRHLAWRRVTPNNAGYGMEWRDGKLEAKLTGPITNGRGEEVQKLPVGWAVPHARSRGYKAKQRREATVCIKDKSRLGQLAWWGDENGDIIEAPSTSEIAVQASKKADAARLGKWRKRQLDAGKLVNEPRNEDYLATIQRAAILAPIDQFESSFIFAGASSPDPLIDGWVADLFPDSMTLSRAAAAWKTQERGAPAAAKAGHTLHPPHRETEVDEQASTARFGAGLRRGLAWLFRWNATVAKPVDTAPAQTPQHIAKVATRDQLKGDGRWFGIGNDEKKRRLLLT